jgi:hypothetical protein
LKGRGRVFPGRFALLPDRSACDFPLDTLFSFFPYYRKKQGRNERYVIHKKILFFPAVIFLVLELAGCGGSSTSAAQNSGGTNGEYSVAAVKDSAPASSCPNGGITVETGLDTNGNGVLDPSEVQNTQYVCNGSNGTNGLMSLVSVTDEPAGSNCADGGKKISSGLDTNNDSIIEASEVTSTNYVCNGANGSNGANGRNGTNGYNTLLATTSEPAGVNCTYGGLKITSGLDTNNDGTLEASEVTSTSYVCNGGGIRPRQTPVT